MTDAKALIREWLDLVATGPAERWPAKAAGEVVIRLPFAPPGVPAELRGAARAIEALGAMWRTIERFSWQDVVIRGTEDPELFVTTARSEVVLLSGQRYTNAYVILTRVRNGKVTEHVEYFNPLPVIEVFFRSEAS